MDVQEKQWKDQKPATPLFTLKEHAFSSSTFLKPKKLRGFSLWVKVNAAEPLLTPNS